MLFRYVNEQNGRCNYRAAGNSSTDLKKKSHLEHEQEKIRHLNESNLTQNGTTCDTYPLG